VIKRISLLISAALVAAMMMVATAAPAFAGTDTEEINGGHYAECQGQCGADDKDATIYNKNGKEQTAGGLEKKADRLKPGNNN
jgi:hypothetical protein